jgi:hypothetical protein
MELYKTPNNELIWSDDYYYDENFDGYIHNDDYRDFWLDDDMSDVEVFELLDTNKQETYILWCQYEQIEPKYASNLMKFLELVES